MFGRIAKNDIIKFMIVGHKRVIDFLDASVRHDMLSQAYLFVGPEGVGKKHIAREFSKWLEGKHSDSFFEFTKKLCVCDTCVSIDGGDYADVRIFSAPLTMENAREIKRACRHTPFFGQYRLIIIDGADSLMHGAGQALLKELEEPASHTIFFLITRTSDSVLPTIASRSTILRFRLVPEKEIELLENVKLSEEFIVYGRGRPGLLFELQNSEVMRKQISEARNEAELFLRGSIDQRFALAEIVGKKERVEISDILERWIIFFAQASAFHAVQCIQEAREAIRANGNAQIALEYAGIRIKNTE
ncbi:MAG: hypothetical protein HYV65_02780 [Candidatus Spechtbacteria bacterium]|nr:hypothetical protein [Candidatus Spechtbacteria bacterium]